MTHQHVKACPKVSYLLLQHVLERVGSAAQKIRDRTTDWSFVIATLGDRKNPAFKMTKGLPSELLSAKTLTDCGSCNMPSLTSAMIRYASQKRPRSVRKQIHSILFFSTRRKKSRPSFHALRRVIPGRILDLY